MSTFSSPNSRRIKEQTILFLKELALNNDRAWFALHKDRYDRAKQDVEAFIESLLLEYAKIDPSLSDLDPKKTLFRIYRDVRFSKDKSPYKSHFAAGFSTKGRTVKDPGYFISIGEDVAHNGHNDMAFFAAGYWMPTPDDLKKIRQEIDYEHAKFQHILDNADFKKAFYAMDVEKKMKKCPAGFPADQSYSDLFKYRSFTVTCPISESDLLSGVAFDKFISCASAAYPFVDFLRRALQ